MAKQLTLIAYGGDRQLWSGGPLQLRVRDLFAEADRETRRLEGAVVQMRFDLPFDGGQMYGLELDGSGYRAAWHVLTRQDFMRVDGASRVEVDDLVLRFMLLPDEARSFDIAGGLARLRERVSPFAVPGSGVSDLDYVGLQLPFQMAFLNIEAKLRETWLSAKPVLDFVKGVREVRADRVFVWLREAAKAQVSRSKEFSEAAGHPGHPDSFKHTAFEEGNVQLSFAKEPQMVAGAPNEAPELCFSVDADIDLGRGLAHAAEWLRNNVFERGHKTDQIDVYGLLYAQGILPLYTLVRNHA